VGDSTFIIGGVYVAPQAWIERLAEVGFRVEVPADERPALGGDFSVRFAHPEVTGAAAARVQVEIWYHFPGPGAPPALVDKLERRFRVLLEERWPDTVLLSKAIPLGWSREGRAGVLRYFDILKSHDVEIDEEIARYWSDPAAKLEQKIEIHAGFNLCAVLAEDVIACAIADATGGRVVTVAGDAKLDRYLTEESARTSIAQAREVPTRFDFSPEDAERWPEFEPFVSWEAIRAEEEAERAEDEKVLEEEESEG
jgi:hypothetical protein